MMRICFVGCVLGMAAILGCNRGVYCTPVETPRANAVSFEIGDVNTSKIKDKYDSGTFTAEYPHFSIEAFDSAVVEKIRAIQTKMEELIKDPDFADREVTVEVGYRIVNRFNGVDILFRIYSNVEGAAHPNEVVETLTIDGAGRILTPEELLKGVDLDVLSMKIEDKIASEFPEYARLDIRAYVKREIVNFRHVVRNDRGGRTVYFDSELLPNVYGVVAVDF